MRVLTSKQGSAGETGQFRDVEDAQPTSCLLGPFDFIPGIDMPSVSILWLVSMVL